MSQIETNEQFRLSPQQKLIWDDRFALWPNCALLAIRIEGDLRVEFLRLAGQKVVDRHEILRTTFQRHPSLKYPLQVISRSGTPAWTVVDLTGLAGEEQERAIEQHFYRHRQQTFDLDVGPVLRMCLFLLSPHKYSLFLAVPSLCGDNRSLLNLSTELQAAYGACLGEVAPVEASLQYADYAEWRNEELAASAATISNISGTTHSHNLQPLPRLAFETEITGSSRTPHSCSTEIASEVCRKIESFARQQDSPTSVVLLAAWQVLLWRFTGISDLVFAYTFHARIESDLMAVLGPFAVCLPFQSRVEDTSTFTEVMFNTSAEVHRLERDPMQPPILYREGLQEKVAAVFECEEWPRAKAVAGVIFSVCRQYQCLSRFKVKFSC